MQNLRRCIWQSKPFSSVLGGFLKRKSCVNDRALSRTTTTSRTDPLHFNARSAAFFLNLINMHYFSSLCSVSWLLMSGYLSYPRENPSLSLFRGLRNSSVTVGTVEHSWVFEVSERAMVGYVIKNTTACFVLANICCLIWNQCIAQTSP